MKKFLLLVFVSLNSFSQVFYLDTTFISTPLVKPFGVQEPFINQFPNGLLYLKFTGNRFNGEVKEPANLLLNADGKLLNSLDNETLFNYDYRLGNTAITPDNKLLITQAVGPSAYTIRKLSQQGVVDTAFNFIDYKPYILKIALLKNENFVLFFLKENSTLAHEVFDKTGKFIKALDPSTYTSATGAQLTDIVSNDLNEYFLLFIDNQRNAEVIKTNADFEVDKNFTAVKLSGIEAYTHTLERVGNDFLVYRASVERLKDKVGKFDRNGAKVWEVSFDKISIHQAGFSFFEQTNGSIDLIYFDNKHLKIKTNGVIDSTFYDRNLHKNTGFLHAFPDGSYWIMRNKNGLIEKMNADGSIDNNFQLVIQSQKQLFPNQIQKLPTNTYLIDFYDYTYNNSPYVIRYSPFPNAVQIYDNKHRLLYDFFDGKTIWKTYKTKNKLVIRGDGKFHIIDEANKITVSKDTLEANDILDWDNNFVYRLVRNDSLIRFKIGQGLDKSFLINDKRIRNVSIMDDKRIAVETSSNINPMQTLYYINMYHTNGKLDSSFKTITLDDSFFKFYGGVPMSIEEANGLIINQMTIGEFANIVKQQFLKYDGSGNPDKNYQSAIYRGGYFRQYEKDGSIFMNTANEVKEDYREIVYNFLKINPKGEKDTTFTILGSDTIYGFEFFDENTLYAVGTDRLQRFIKQPLKKDEYFYYQRLPEKIAWNVTVPTPLKISTNVKDIKVQVSGNAKLENGYLYFEPKAGNVSITIIDNTSRILARQKIELTRIYPFFVYDESLLSTAQAPFEFKVHASSGLPVKISVDGGNEYTGSIMIDRKRDRSIKIKLRSEGNEQYEAIEKEIVLEKLILLAAESEISTNKIVYYPNPVADKLIIQKDNFILDTIRVISIDGKERETNVQEYSDRYELSMTNLEHGLYIIILRTKDQQFAYRILKE